MGNTPWTLIPEVGLGNSGYFDVAAIYGAVPMPAGFPLWILWAWFFTTGLLFSNIERRAAIATAVAGALACGLIALMVCHIGSAMRKRLLGENDLTSQEHGWLCAVCGYASGMVFGLSKPFWAYAVIADPLTFNNLLLCCVMWTLFCWACEPNSKRWLLASAFLYGILLINSRIELAFAPAIPFMVALHHREAGRDMLMAASLLFLGGWVLKYYGHFPSLAFGGASFVYLLLSLINCLAAAALTIRTHGVFSEWRTVLYCLAFTALGLSIYIYLAIASMTNPPANWGYARTVEGFFHLITRGQYDAVYISDKAIRYAGQIGQYFSMALTDFGWPYLLTAVIPILSLLQLGVHGRKFIMTMIVAYIFLAFLIVAVLNATPERQTQSLIKLYFCPSYVIAAVLMGCGLIILGGSITRLFSRRADVPCEEFQSGS